MRIRSIAVVLFVLVLSAAIAPARAQNAGKAPAPTSPAVTALMMEVTISRYLGEKRLSSTPYSIAVNPGERASSLRMGGEIPIPSTTFTPVQKGDAGPAKPMTSFGYRNIGTNIDVRAEPSIDGRYEVTITIEESSVYPDELAPSTSKSTGAPAFRSFRSVNVLVLRDAQSVEYTTATDRLTGEVYRVTAKMSVVK
jgi:hypothetical protein